MHLWKTLFFSVVLYDDNDNNGCASGCLLCSLWPLPWHSPSAAASVLPDCLACLYGHTHGPAPLAVPLLPWNATSHLLWFVASPLTLFRIAISIGWTMIHLLHSVISNGGQRCDSCDESCVFVLSV